MKFANARTLCYVMDLAEIYMDAGRLEDADKLIGEYHYYLDLNPLTSDKLAIFHSRIRLAQGDYEDRTSKQIHDILSRIPENKLILGKIDRLRCESTKCHNHTAELLRTIDSLEQELAIRHIEPGNLLNRTDKMKKQGQFTPGAKMTVVTACQENERNFEYKADNGKMYGSLSYFIYTLLKSNADFDKWDAQFTDKAFTSRKIFQPSQHPSIEIIR